MTSEKLLGKSKSMMTESTTKQEVIGRNEPCPCKSGKKYKRCCGINAAPKLSTPNSAGGFPAAGAEAGAPGTGFDPNALASQMDPAMMMQFMQAIQRLPKGQLQRLQAIMQKAMNGRDVSAEAAELEKSLPVDFQNLIHSFKLPMGAMGMGQDLSSAPATETSTSAMTEEQARALVAKAAEEGAISKEQAESLLKSTQEAQSTESLEVQDSGTQNSESSDSKENKDSKIGKFWRNISGKNK